MTLPKRKFREIVFQLTFSKDLNSGTDALLSCALLDQMKITKKNLREAFDQVAHIIEKQEEIDALISKGSKSSTSELRFVLTKSFNPSKLEDPPVKYILLKNASGLDFI